MNKETDELIQLYLSGKADEKAIEQLRQWLQANEEHRRYFLFEKNLYEGTHPAFAPDNIDETKALQNIIDVLHTKKKATNHHQASQSKHTLLLWIASSAAVIATIIYIGINSLQTFPEQSGNLTTNITTTEIKPGNSKAILTLGSGKQIALEKDSTMSIQDAESETSIQNRNGKIEYSASTTKPSEKTTYHELYVPVGGEYYLQLNDGSKVWLNAGTRLKYPPTFSNGERLVYLTGEAYFDVAKDPQRPFKVICSNSEISVLGTEFNVCNYTDDATSAVTLAHGSVSVKASGSGEHLKLSPGEQSVLTNKTAHLNKRQVDIRLYCSWKDGELFFDHTRLEDIMKRLSKWYDVSVDWKDPQLKELTISGEMKKYESLNEILELLQMTQNMKFKIEGRTIIVSK